MSGCFDLKCPEYFFDCYDFERLYFASSKAYSYFRKCRKLVCPLMVRISFPPRSSTTMSTAQKYHKPWGSLLIFCLILFFGKAHCELRRSCEPIRIEMCRDVGYNVTGMPNLVNHDLQQDAQLELQSFTPLIQYSCASQLKFFLCSVYVPMCTEKVSEPIGPCRPLCLDVYQRCHPVLKEFGYVWPSALNCSKFPIENNQRHMCMEGPGPSDHEKINPVHSYRDNSYTGTGRTEVKTPRPTTSNLGLCDKYRDPSKYFYMNHSNSCGHACNSSILYTSDNKAFAEIWIAVWAGLCFISTFLTVAVFLADASQFRYPERAIIFISGCYNIYSIAFFIRLFAGHSSVACYQNSQHKISMLVQGGLNNTQCTLIFILLYFFGTASEVWWLVLTVTWFLAVGRHWGPEAIERLCTYFHLVAWALPSAQTIAVLVLQYVDADELTGLCYVGNQSKPNLLAFVILPTCIYLAAGAIALMSGVVAILKCRQKQTEVKNERLEALMARIGIFALLYTVPATCVLAVNFYEYFSRDSWLSGSTRPNVEIFSLKIFMSLVIGITTALWIWSSKASLSVWHRLTKQAKKRPATAPPITLRRSQNSLHQVTPLVNLLVPSAPSARSASLEKCLKKPGYRGEIYI